MKERGRVNGAPLAFMGVTTAKVGSGVTMTEGVV